MKAVAFIARERARIEAEGEIDDGGICHGRWIQIQRHSFFFFFLSNCKLVNISFSSFQVHLRKGRLGKKSNGVHKNRIRASGVPPDEHSERSECGSSARKKPWYHPSEELGKNVLSPQEDDAQLTDAVIARTMIELLPKVCYSRHPHQYFSSNSIMKELAPKIHAYYLNYPRVVFVLRFVSNALEIITFLLHVQGNINATLMFSGTVSDEIHEKIFWPELPYATDEHGDIYFEVHGHQDVIQALTVDSNFVQVFIGLDNIEKLHEMELSGPSAIGFEIDEITDEDEDDDEDEDEDDEEEEYDDDEDDDDGDDDDEEEDDDYDEEEGENDDDDDEDWVSFLEDEEEDDLISSEALGDWANLETMRSTHPMYFAQKISEVVSSPNLDRMDPPSTALSIQGLLRPAFIEESAIVRRHMASKKAIDDHTDQTAKLVGSNAKRHGISNGQALGSGFRTSSIDNVVRAEDLDKKESIESGTIFYKLEMIKIQLDVVDVSDLRHARPDLIAHSSAKILSRLNGGGEKTLQALKALCVRMKGIQAEEVLLIGVDSLGFDLRVCSGTQVQTLRFAFSKQATSEFAAERQLHDLLFPRISQSSLQKQPEARSKDS
ncbi:hypothetical protein ACLOJK_020784 [Asimina triloba]